MKMGALGPQCDSFVMKSDPTPEGVFLIELTVCGVQAGGLDDEGAEDTLSGHRDRLPHRCNGVLLGHQSTVEKVTEEFSHFFSP